MMSRKMFSQTVFFSVLFMVVWPPAEHSRGARSENIFGSRGKKNYIGAHQKSDDYEPFPQNISEKFRAGDYRCQLFARRDLGRNEEKRSNRRPIVFGPGVYEQGSRRNIEETGRPGLCLCRACQLCRREVLWLCTEGLQGVVGQSRAEDAQRAYGIWSWG